MQSGYDTDRWVGCQCGRVNYSNIIWVIIITIILLNILNPECIEGVSSGLVAIGDLMVLANGGSCIGNICSRGCLV